MSRYRAPLQDMQFVLRELAGLDEICRLPGFDDNAADVADAVLEGADRFASDVLAPLNRVGDCQGARLIDGEVRTPDGFREAYAQYIAGGWGGLIADTQFGGQALPRLLWTPVQEMWKGANLSFLAVRMCGAVPLLRMFGLVAGGWQMGRAALAAERCLGAGRGPRTSCGPRF